jgi:hypothetical protein
LLGGAGGGVFANVLHAGGMVGDARPQRLVPAMAFAGAPRLHDGGWPGLRPDEVPAILQRGERVLSRARRAATAAGRQRDNVTSMPATPRASGSRGRRSRPTSRAGVARAEGL